MSEVTVARGRMGGISKISEWAEASVLSDKFTALALAFPASGYDQCKPVTLKNAVTLRCLTAFFRVAFRT